MNRKILGKGPAMYNSKRFETVKNMRENKKISNAVQAAIGVLAVVLAALIVWMMVLVSGIQGTARVVNYAGLVRGETQRLVKMEIAGQAEDEMMESVESFINGLRFGDDELTLVRLDDKSFQTKMEELASCFESLKQEIYLVREKGFEKTDIIDKSEKFFDICDEATGLAETYSQKRASSLAVLERYITADIVVLMMLIGYEFIKALHYTAMNHALQKKVYMDEATGLPNKNKCEELLSAPEMITMPVGVCSFDLNNLRRINNSMGHEKGDAYIRIFAELVREAVAAHYFVGRAGGAEFIGILAGAGIALCFSQGGSTGGTDIVAMIINKYRTVSYGKILIYSDFVIIGSALLVGMGISAVIYGYVMTAVVGYTVDMIMAGNQQSSQVFIVTHDYEKMAQAIVDNVHRGVTLIDSQGWYSKKESKIVMVVCRKRETSMILKFVKTIDPEAFMTVGSVMGVYGKGFQAIGKG